MKKITAALITTMVTVIGCAWLDRSEREKIIGDYEVAWDDLESNRSITKSNSHCGEGCSDVIVDSYVYSVGHNERFIFAKQHPNMKSAKTKYFLIDIIENGKDTRNGIYGPLDEAEFKALVMKLGISDIVFHLNFPEAP
jgi:hypothetical protein